MGPLLFFVATAAAGMLTGCAHAELPATPTGVAHYAERLLADLCGLDAPAVTALIVDAGAGDEMPCRGLGAQL